MSTPGVSRRWWLLLAAIALAAFVAAQSNTFQVDARGRDGGMPAHVPGHVHELMDRAESDGTVRVIVRTRGPAEQALIARQARGEGARIGHQYKNFPMVAMTVNENALRGLASSPHVVSIVEDGYDEPLLDESLPVIGGDIVRELGWDGGGYTVAILDTGIDRNHPFVQGRVVAELCFSDPGDDENRSTLCPNGEITDEGVGSASSETGNCWSGTRNICDHGPHVAGIAAGDGSGDVDPNAPVAGVAPGANIIAIQVFHRVENACGNNPTPCVLSAWSDQIAAMDALLDLAENDDSIIASNMSLGGGQFSEACDDPADNGDRKEPIDALRAAGVATIVASGNNGFAAAIGRPACISTAIAVGATNNDDGVTRNRGVLLDYFAPGVGIDSAIDTAGGYGSKSGTSMAAPHVAGAWAVLRQADPTLTLDETIDLLKDTGVPITYPSGGEDVTTPRIDLLAALNELGPEPEVTVDSAEVTVDEGEVAENTGTYSSGNGGDVMLSASVGEVTDDGNGEWSWSFETVDGPADSQTVTITATNSYGVEADETFALVVDNVAPTVTIDPDQVTIIDEGDSLSVNASFTDPGIEDAPFTASVVCYEIDATPTIVPVAIEVTSVNDDTGLLEGTVSATCVYGDTSQSGDPPSGTFTVKVTVKDKDGGEGEASFDVTVRNVDPTVEIDTANALDINSVPTIVATVGEDVDFSANVTDPGSDDIFLEWDWDDGSTSTVDYHLVDAANPDPFPSPNVSPRDITDEQTHVFGNACLFDVVLTATDDDGGKGSDSIAVIIVGDAAEARGAGYWLHQYRGRGHAHFDTGTLDCYLAIVGHMSSVFHDERDASTRQKAAQVLHPAGNQGDMVEIFEHQLLALWLNFANGAYGLDDLVYDSSGDGVFDTTFAEVVEAAEATRLDDDASSAELEAHKDIVEAVNLRHGG